MLIDLGVDERFPAGDGDDGRAALVGGLPALLGGEVGAQDLLRMLDLAAALAFEVAAVGAAPA